MSTTYLRQAVLNSSVFSTLGLSTSRIRSVEVRIKYAREISQKITSWLAAGESERKVEKSLRSFLEELELDICSCMGVDPEVDGATNQISNVTSWEINCTWAKSDDPASEGDLGQLLWPEVRREIEMAAPPLTSNKSQILGWLGHKGNGLKAALDRLSGTEESRVAILCLVVVNVFLADLLAGLTKMHLAIQPYFDGSEQVSVSFSGDQE